MCSESRATTAEPVPVVLFAYARPSHLAMVLQSIRLEKIPMLHVFSDGAKDDRDAPRVAEVRQLINGIDWCEVLHNERATNLGLGRNVLSGLDEMAARYDAFIVFEDDLVCVPGTYRWLCAALQRYQNEERVMSVTAWTHPRVTPPGQKTAYFDARAECWVWGTFARAWKGMDETASEKIRRCAAHGIRPEELGSDLPVMAREELARNTWAVRWLYHHLQHGGLCLRPPWSMVEHIGFDSAATNAEHASAWANPPLRNAPSAGDWPKPIEHPACRALWRAANPPMSHSLARRIAQRILPARLKSWINARRAWVWFRGDYRDWNEARRASSGYDEAAIVDRARDAARRVRAGDGSWERDGVVFTTAEVNTALLHALHSAARDEGELDVVDIGGAFGGVWWQHRAYLDGMGLQRWAIVEQRNYVTAGRAEFSAAPLCFFETISEAVQGRPAHLALLSCVLPYVEDPNEMLRQVAAAGFAHIILDRTPLARDGRRRLAVQHVPPQLGGGSYPAWIFDRSELLRILEKDYELCSEWPGFDAVDPDVAYRGFHFRRRAVKGGRG